MHRESTPEAAGRPPAKRGRERLFAVRVEVVDHQMDGPDDDSTVTTPTMLAMIQAIISLGLHAVEDALQAEVTALAGLWRLGGRDGGLAPLCATMPLTGLPESAPTE